MQDSKINNSFKKIFIKIQIQYKDKIKVKDSYYKGTSFATFYRPVLNNNVG